MTTSPALLTDAFGRVRELAERVTAGLDVDDLTERVDSDELQHAGQAAFVRGIHERRR